MLLSVSNCQNRLSLLQLASITVVMCVNYFNIAMSTYVVMLQNLHLILLQYTVVLYKTIERYNAQNLPLH